MLSGAALVMTGQGETHDGGAFPLRASATTRRFLTREPQEKGRKTATLVPRNIHCCIQVRIEYAGQGGQ